MSDNLPRPASDALVSDMLDAYRDDEGFGEDVRRLAARIRQDRRRMDAVRALCEQVAVSAGGLYTGPAVAAAVMRLLDGDGEARP